MVVVELSKKTNALNALMTIGAYAILISEGTDWFFGKMELRAMPYYTVWLVAGALTWSALAFYSFLCGTKLTGWQKVPIGDEASAESHGASGLDRAAR